MLQQIEREQARRALKRALKRRRGRAIGTPLQEMYLREYGAPMPAGTTTFWGAEMQVVLPELVSCEIYEHGVIEPTLTALFIEVVRKGTVVYDVGAHLGYYSLIAAALGGKVHAFEPSKSTLPILEENVQNRATISPTAFWSEDTTLRLKDFGSAHSAVNTFLSPKDERLGEPEDDYPVRVTTLDRHVAKTGDVPRLIKIDVEGAELQVLQGAETTIRAAQPLVTVEVGDTAKERTSRSAIEFAIDLDYVPYELTDQGPRPHEVCDVYEYGNLLLVPRGTEPPIFS